MTQTASNKKIALFTGKFDFKFKEETTKVSNLINDFHLRSPRGSYFLSENSKTILINKYYFLGGGQIVIYCNLCFISKSISTEHTTQTNNFNRGHPVVCHLTVHLKILSKHNTLLETNLGDQFRSLTDHLHKNIG